MDSLHHGFRTPAIRSAVALDDAIRAVAVETENGLSWESLSATATIVVTPNGAPIRTIVTGRRPIVTGTYASRKAGRPLPYESMLERAFFMHSEVDPDVVDYRAQPFRLEFIIAGVKRTYIVDCLRLLADNSIEIVEIKRDRRALRDPHYAVKLEAVRIICERVGWRFRIVFASELLDPEYVYENILEVQSCRLTEFDRSDVFIVTEALLRRSPLTMGELGDVLGDRLLGIAKLKAMAVKRIVRIDLTRPLFTETSVELVSRRLSQLRLRWRGG